MLTVIGIDPGPNTGICVVKFITRTWGMMSPAWYQCDGAAAAKLCTWINDSVRDSDTIKVQIEDFVSGNGAGNKGEAADITRSLVNKLGALFPDADPVYVRATDVKPWATDKRLEKAGLLYPYAGTAMRHANDAARHALYRAVKTGWPDPLA